MELLKKINARLDRFHQDANGAVVLVMLAAFLALFMMGLVVYDTTISVADKMDVQTAADSASWSQSTIEARTMNMVAFTNVSKRVTVGMTTMYSAAIEANRVVAGVLSGATIACWGLTVCPGPCQTYLVPICKELSQLAIKANEILWEERPDIRKFENGLIDDFFGKDLQALDNYQTYMIDMTPWWGWAEGVLRGVQSGATTTSSFPVPDNLSGGLFAPLSGLVSQSSVQDRLPLGRGEQSGDDLAINRTDKMCDGVESGFPDKTTWMTEFFIKTIPHLSGWREFAIIGLMEAYIGVRYNRRCSRMVSTYGDIAKPVEVHRNLSRSEWLMYTSNLTLAYYADASKFSEDGDRGSYGFTPADYTTSMGTTHGSPGYWALSRSEISYRGNEPVGEWKWNPRWTTRMRPVALPGEWKGLASDEQLKNAWRDMAPLLWGTATVLDFLGMTNGEFNIFGEGGFVTSDAPRMDAAASGMDEDLIEGVPK